MLQKNIRLRGKMVSLRGINETDFGKIVKWRNDPEINRYLNQPFRLTVEMQAKWYYEKYLPSDDILFVFVTNDSNIPIGTLGVNDIDYDLRRAIAGRLLIGEKKYRGSVELLEGNLIFYDFLFYILGLKEVYCHIVRENKKAIALDTRLGFFINKSCNVYPDYCCVNNMHLIEMVNTKASYKEHKNKLLPMLEHFISQNEKL